MSGSAPASFPPVTAALPPGAALVETFGWQRLNYGSLLLAFAVYGVFGQPGRTPLEWGIIAVCAALGVALLGWTWTRRRSRVVLVPRSGKVAVYRGGELVKVASPRDFIVFLPDSLNTWKGLFGLSAFSAGMFFAVLAAPGALDKAMAFLAGCVFASSAASSYRTRKLCTEFTLVEPKGKLNTRFMLSRQDGARLLNAGVASASLEPPTAP